jgi:plastocyanin
MRALSGPVCLLLGMALALLAAAAACGGESFSLPTPGPGGETVIRIDMGDNFFSPSDITIRSNEKYILQLHNRGKVPHNLRIAGADGEFDTEDDIASEIIDGGKTGTLAVDMTVDGTFPFRCDLHAVEMKGTLTVWTKPFIPSPTPSPTPTPTPVPTPTPEATPTPEVTPTPEATPTEEPAPISTIPPSTP